MKSHIDIPSLQYMHTYIYVYTYIHTAYGYDAHEETHEQLGRGPSARKKLTYAQQMVRLIWIMMLLCSSLRRAADNFYIL